jgi:hypothetical protein
MPAAFNRARTPGTSGKKSFIGPCFQSVRHKASVFLTGRFDLDCPKKMFWGEKTALVMQLNPVSQAFPQRPVV